MSINHGAGSGTSHNLSISVPPPGGAAGGGPLQHGGNHNQQQQHTGIVGGAGGNINYSSAAGAGGGGEQQPLVQSHAIKPPKNPYPSLTSDMIQIPVVVLP